MKKVLLVSAALFMPFAATHALADEDAFLTEARKVATTLPPN